MNPGSGGIEGLGQKFPQERPMTLIATGVILIRATCINERGWLEHVRKMLLPNRKVRPPIRTRG